jgi:hypothetical protein
MRTGCLQDTALWRGEGLARAADKTHGNKQTKQSRTINGFVVGAHAVPLGKLLGQHKCGHTVAQGKDAETTDVNALELRVSRAERPTGPHHTRKQPQATQTLPSAIEEPMN